MRRFLRLVAEPSNEVLGVTRVRGWDVHTDQAVWDASMGELMAFVALHQAGTFTGAARMLHLSQAGFSARILRLERAVGQRLVDRTVRPAELTPAGKTFLPYAFALLRAMADGRAAANGVQSPRRPAVSA